MLPLDREDLDHVLKHATSCMKELGSSRIFIAGGTGFFGKWLLESLLYAKDQFNSSVEIDVLSRNPGRFLASNPHLDSVDGLSFVKGDVSNFSAPSAEYTHVIHAATEASLHLNETNPLVMLDTNLDGTRHMLEFAKAVNAKKMLFTSSGAVYGRQPADLSHVQEGYVGGPDPLDENSAYAIGKCAAEHMCALYNAKTNVEIKIARCFAFVGPHLPLDTHFAIGNFILNAIRGESISIKGDGTPRRSYLYAADLVIWLLTILCHGQAGQAYNVGSEHEINLSQLAHSVANQTDPALLVNIAKQAKPDQRIHRYVPSTQKAQAELSLRQYIDLDSAIEKTIDWNKRCNKNLQTT